jgi:hypothetical protein
MRCSESLLDFFAQGSLGGQQEGSYEFSFTTNNHAGKSLEPFPLWNYWLRVQPFDHQGKLAAGNVSLLNPLQ